MHRPAGLPVPEHGGLPLVGDADRVNVAGFEAALVDRFLRDARLRGPDLLGIVLDEAGGGEVLCELPLGRRSNGAVIVKDDGP